MSFKRWLFRAINSSSTQINGVCEMLTFFYDENLGLNLKLFFLENVFSVNIFQNCHESLVKLSTLISVFTRKLEKIYDFSPFAYIIQFMLSITEHSERFVFIHYLSKCYFVIKYDTQKNIWQKRSIIRMACIKELWTTKNSSQFNSVHSFFSSQSVLLLVDNIRFSFMNRVRANCKLLHTEKNNGKFITPLPIFF